jgi:hypothetical protein
LISQPDETVVLTVTLSRELTTDALALSPLSSPSLSVFVVDNDVCPPGQHFVNGHACVCDLANAVISAADSSVCECDARLYVASTTPLGVTVCVLRAPFTWSSRTIPASTVEGVALTTTVALATAPATGSVVQLVVVGSSDLVTVSPALLSFSADDWNVARTVTVTRAVDAIVRGTVSAFAQLAVSSTTTDAAFLYSSSTNTLTFSVADADVPKVSVSLTSLSVLSGSSPRSSASYGVSLGTRPSSRVTVQVAQSSTMATVSPSVLTFDEATWSTPQSVKVVSAAVLPAGVSVGTVLLSHSATDAAGVYVVPASAAPEVSVSVFSQAAMSLSLLPASATLTEGTSASVRVKLSVPPIEPVEVFLALTGDDGGLGVIGSRVSFTTSIVLSSDAAVTVPLTVDVDGVSTGDESATLTVSSRGSELYSAMVSSATISLVDADVPGISMTLPANLVVYEGSSGASESAITARLLQAATGSTAGDTTTAWYGRGVFNVALHTLPRSRVVVAVVSTEGSAVNRQRLDSLAEFVPSRLNAGFSLEVPDDKVFYGTRKRRMTATVAFSDALDNRYKTVKAEAEYTVVDNDTPGLTITQVESVVDEGKSGRLFVRLRSVPVPGSLVTVQLTSSMAARVVLSATTVVFTDDAPVTVTYTVQRDNIVMPDTAIEINADDRPVLLRRGHGGDAAVGGGACARDGRCGCEARGRRWRAAVNGGLVRDGDGRREGVCVADVHSRGVDDGAADVADGGLPHQSQRCDADGGVVLRAIGCERCDVYTAHRRRCGDAGDVPSATDGGRRRRS